MVADHHEASDIVSHNGPLLSPGDTALDDHASPLSANSEPGTANQKNALMKMIAQEMVQAFVDPEKEAENDEKLLQSRFDDNIKHERMLKKAGRRNRQNSGDVNKLTREEVMEGSAKRRNRLKAAHRWSSTESPDDEGKISESPVIPSRDWNPQERLPHPLADDSIRADSTNQTSVIEDELSIEEIRQFVINNIPKAVRDQIPEDAWVKIFGGAASKGGSGISRRSLEQASGSEHDSNTKLDDLDVDPPDDMSAISALTGLTSAFPDGKSVESRVLSMCTIETENKVADSAPNPDVVEEHAESSHQSCGEADTFDAKNAQEEAAPRGKGVLFDTVEVRFYERIGVDNPAVTSGPAVGIGWNYSRGGRQPINLFESRKGKPLKSFELLMDRAERERILTMAGYTQKDIAEVVRTCLKGRNQRQQTVNNLQHANAEEAVESAKRRISKIMRFGKKKSLIK